MKTSKEARKISRELFKASLENGRLKEDRVRLIAAQILKSKPRHFVGIFKDYERRVRMELARHHAKIESATQLDDATRQSLEASLRGKYGQDLTTEFSVTPELLGGVRIKIGSDVFDSSVRERLNRLETALS